MNSRAYFSTYCITLALWAAAAALPAQELDENCVVSILNRTARVRADGSWRIDNVPANFGLVRARFTCSHDGETFSGQSDFFEITEDIVNGFNPEYPSKWSPSPNPSPSAPRRRPSAPRPRAFS